MLIDSLENKQKILNHFLESCLLEDWSEKALEEAFEKSEIDIKFLPFIFENGVAEIADLFIKNIDEKMLEKAKYLDFDAMKIRDKIKNLVKIRLDLNQEFKPQIQKLINFYSQPMNSRLALKNSYKAADLMWKIAGDNATDFNYYSKRIILAKIYIRTLSCFAKDGSENSQKTLDLLDKEIEKVMKIAAFKFKVKSSCQKASKLLKKAAIFKSDLKENPKDFIRKLPFFRLYK
ncbi:MAG: ubiquinone biosynthesis protein COQ9 [Rickettsiales bacterium]|jgi:ubiquinone biosynthesis protein COQ9